MSVLNLFSTEGFMPHGQCILWQPNLLGLHVISDSIIALSYFMMPVAFFYYMRKKEVAQFKWTYYLFIAFFLLCGSGHLLGIITIWHPEYWVEGFIKAGTAGVSIAAMVFICRSMPQALALPSPETLLNMNQTLEDKISERKIAEEELNIHRNNLKDLVDKRSHELKQSLLRFKTYFELPLIGIAITSPDKGWEEANLRLCDILGYSREELFSLTWDKLTHPEDLKKDVDLFSKVVSGKLEGYDLEKRFIKKGGEIIDTEISVGCVRKEDGTLDYFVALIQDITERKRAEEKLKKSHMQLVHADKLASLGKLVGSVAHEFNNPLFGITNLVDQLGDDRPLEERKKFSEVAKKECKRMATLIKDLQSFYKPSQGVASPVELNKLIDEVLTVIGKDIKQKGIKVSRVNADSKVVISAVEDQLKQVVINLLQNASDSFSSNTGEIILTAEQDEKSTTIKVQDTGAGIPKEIIPNLFDPFFTTKGVKGTGLGLSLSYGIIQSHGGEIKVDSELGKGSTFTLVLPTQGVLK